MSYRNPTYYGIVEDMTAFNDAFQKSFGEIAQVIEKNKLKREQEEKQDQKYKAQEITDQANREKKVDIDFIDALQSQYNFYADTLPENYYSDPVIYAKLNREMDYTQRFLTGLGDVKGNIDNITGMDPGVKSALRKFFRGEIRSVPGEKGLTIDGYDMETIAKALEQADRRQGTAESSAQIRSKLGDGLLNKMKAAQNDKGSNLTEEEKLKIANDHIKQGVNASLITDERNDHFWEFVIPQEKKNTRNLSVSVLKGQDMDMSTLNYNLYDLQKLPNETIEAGEKIRNEIVADHYAELLAGDIGSQLQPYVAPKTSDTRLSATAEKEGLKRTEIESARKAMEGILLENKLSSGAINPKMPNRPISNILKDFNDEILAKNYRIVPGDEEGQYILENTKATAQEIKDGLNKSDITKFVEALKNGNTELLIDRLMAKVYGESAMYRGININ